MELSLGIRQKVSRILTILLPILVTQLTMYAMNFFDTIMSGQVSARDLAGVAIGSNIWTPVMTGLSGILMAVTPIVAQLLGAARRDQVAFSVNQGIYLAVFLSLAVIAAGAVVLSPLLQMMDLEPSVRHIAFHYLVGLSFGIMPLFVYTVLRSFIDALGQTRITMFIILTTLPINIGLNYLLIFGKGGFPRLGGIGAGYATAITYWCIAFISILVVMRLQPIASFQVFGKLYRFSLATWKELLTIGVPIGFSIFFEVSIFSAVTLLMSKFSTATIAAHQAAMNFASFLYMIPMSIAMALTIAVGFEVGARRMKDARQYSYLGIGISVTMGLVSMVTLFLFHDQVAQLYSKDAEVLELAKHFLIYAIFFQLSDALAAPIQGVLRGYKDVNVTLIAALISYWIIGLPTGYLLANYTSFGPSGYWLGLITGLLSGAVCLLIRLLYIQRRAFHEQTSARL